MAMKTPLQTVNEMHGGKEKLVEKLMGLIEKGELEAEELKARLMSASNKKLLRLLRIAETVKQKFGTPQKLAEAVAAALGRAKDSDYVRRLGEFSTGRLLDMAHSLERRVGSAIGTASQTAKETAAKVAKAAKPTPTKASAKEKAPKAEKEKKPAKAKEPAAKKAAPKKK
jgi:hypothetical protein